MLTELATLVINVLMDVVDVSELEYPTVCPAAADAFNFASSACCMLVAKSVEELAFCTHKTEAT